MSDYVVLTATGKISYALWRYRGRHHNLPVWDNMATSITWSQEIYQSSYNSTILLTSTNLTESHTWLAFCYFILLPWLFAACHADATGLQGWLHHSQQ